LGGGGKDQKLRESATAGLKMREKGILKYDCMAANMCDGIGTLFLCLLGKCKGSYFFELVPKYLKYLK
jgi:hypothetical protein